MLKCRNGIAKILVCALVGSCLIVNQTETKASVKGYTISKKAGTYMDKVTVKVKAKKGYTVYYTTGKNLSKSNKIRAKKTKSFTFKKTSTLRLYAVKKSKKMTAKTLKTVKTKSMAKYRYKIVKKKNSSEANTTVATTSGSKTDVMPSGTPLETGGTVVPTDAGKADGKPDQPTNSPMTTPGDSLL